MRKGHMVILSLMVVLFSASCTTFKFEGAQVTRELPSFNTVGTFETTITVHEFLGASGGANFLNVTAGAMNTRIYDAIQREIMKFTGDAAVNVTIEYQAGLIDMILNSLTFGLYAPATARISGTIVKYN